MNMPTFLEMMGVSDSGISPHKDSLTLYDYEELEYYEMRFEKMRSQLLEQAKPKIPKLLHFIWVGPNPFPDGSVANIISWKQYHPDWQYIFWTDNHKPPIEEMKQMDVSKYDFGDLNEYLAKTAHPAEQADLMRYAILNDFGGFYADHDATCLHSFDSLLQFEFVAGFEYPHWHGGLDSAVVFANGLFGSTPNNPIFKSAIEHVQRIWKELDERFPDEPGKPAPRWKIIRRAFDSFTLAIKEQIKRDGAPGSLFLPTSYFFPDIILSETDIARFQELGVVWARHGYTKLW